MGYFRLFLTYRLLIFYGFLATLFCCFGQTFFVSLFVPDLLSTFSISKTEFGSYYSLATLLSAACLPIVGKWIDHMPLARYSAGVCIGLIAAALLMSYANSIVLLVIALWGIRLTGQGLLVHISGTTMARYFGSLRGKALSLAGLGFCVGEALYPLLGAFCIKWLGWRATWQLVAGIALLILLPIMMRLPKYFLKVVDGEKGAEKSSPTSWSRQQVLGDIRFYSILPSCLTPSLVLTGLFLYQLSLAESKGWSAEWMASCFIAFALTRVVTQLLIGPIVDKWGAVKLFPWHLTPFLLGLILLAEFSHPLIGMLYLSLSGMTISAGGNIKSAIWAEVYGIRHLGAIRSMHTMAAVFATALGPILVSYFLDKGLGFPTLIWGCVLGALVATLFSFWGCRKYRISESFPSIKDAA